MSVYNTTQQISDPPYDLTETSPFAVSPQVFHSKLKTMLLNKPYSDHLPPPPPPPPPPPLVFLLILLFLVFTENTLKLTYFAVMVQHVTEYVCTCVCVCVCVQLICSYVMWPMAYIIGIEYNDCQEAAKLMGIKLFTTEVFAYQELGKSDAAGLLSVRETGRDTDTYIHTVTYSDRETDR